MQFPPGLKANGSVNVFVGELYRNAKLNHTRMVRLRLSYALFCITCFC